MGATSTPTSGQRGPGEQFEVSLDSMDRATNTTAPTVTVRIDDHPEAAARVSVRREDTTWRFSLAHAGELQPQKRVTNGGTPTTITSLPGWLEWVLHRVGFDDVEMA